MGAWQTVTDVLAKTFVMVPFEGLGKGLNSVVRSVWGPFLVSGGGVLLVGDSFRPRVWKSLHKLNWQSFVQVSVDFLDS